MQGLEAFIVKAKQATYVGGGNKTAPCRKNSHDLAFMDGDWAYLDSYFGGTDFLGQEVVWHSDQPIWAMNYHGFILRPDLIDADRAGNVIKAALSRLYREGRFLGGHIYQTDGFTYTDKTHGTHARFQGVERILATDTIAYELRYHGGLVRA